MPNAKGFLTIAGVGEESTYGTEVLATQQIKTLTWELNDVVADLLDESLTGSNAQVLPEAGVKDVTGGWSALLTYTTEHLLLKHFFGDYSAGRYVMAPSLEGTGLTWAIDEQVNVATATGVKINQLVFHCAPGFITLTGTAIAKDLIRTSTVNTAATLAALAPELNPRCKYTDVDIRLGVASAPLTSTEHIDVAEVTITFTRALAQTHIAGTRSIYEPDEDGWFNCEIALTLPRYNSTQYKSWAASKTPLALRLFLDAENSSKSYELVIPGVSLTDSPNTVSGPGFLTQQITALGRVYQHQYTASTIAAVATGNKLTSSVAGFPQVSPGAAVRISGFTGDTDNNGAATIVSRSASELVLADLTLSDDTAGEPIVLTFREPLAYIVET